MSITLNHLQRFMPGQMHDVVKRHTALNQTRCKRVSQVMKTEVFNPCFFPCLIKSRLVALDRFAFVCEHKSGIFWPQVQQSLISTLAKPYRAILTILGLDVRNAFVNQVPMAPI